MIPVTQTKVVVRNSLNKIIVHGNCYAACIASLLEIPITEVPNIETLFDIEGQFFQDVMTTFLSHKGFELISDDRFKVFHDENYEPTNKTRSELLKDLKDQYYLVSGMSNRDVLHLVIYQNGKMVHDPHPTREGILKIRDFQVLVETW